MGAVLGPAAMEKDLGVGDGSRTGVAGGVGGTADVGGANADLEAWMMLEAAGCARLPWP